MKENTKNWLVGIPVIPGLFTFLFMIEHYPRFIGIAIFIVSLTWGAWFLGRLLRL